MALTAAKILKIISGRIFMSILVSMTILLAVFCSFVIRMLPIGIYDSLIYYKEDAPFLSKWSEPQTIVSSDNHGKKFRIRKGFVETPFYDFSFEQHKNEETQAVIIVPETGVFKLRKGPVATLVVFFIFILCMEIVGHKTLANWINSKDSNFQKRIEQ